MNSYHKICNFHRAVFLNLGVDLAFILDALVFDNARQGGDGLSKRPLVANEVLRPLQPWLKTSCC
jgi:hypothetical protein